MKYFILFCMVLTLGACAHHHNKEEHHHHAFNKLCAYEVSQDHFETQGNEKYQVTHEGETYYFSTEEKMNEFKADIKANSAKAKTNFNRRFR